MKYLTVILAHAPELFDFSFEVLEHIEEMKDMIAAEISLFKRKNNPEI